LRVLVVFPLVFLLSVLPMLKSCGEPEWPAGFPHGEEILPSFEDPDQPGAFFDFSSGSLVFGDEGRQKGDIYLDKTFIAGNPALNVALHDDMADSLLYKTAVPSFDWTERPDENTAARISIYNGHCVWVRTGEGYYGKLKILQVESNESVSSFNWIKIQWIYQPDGTNQFRNTAVAVPGTVTE